MRGSDEKASSLPRARSRESLRESEAWKDRGSTKRRHVDDHIATKGERRQSRRALHSWPIRRAAQGCGVHWSYDPVGSSTASIA
jgi:hypothetical protein